jgi:tRNA (adenine57-N1/adenine58-N1)-methyltransferase
MAETSELLRRTWHVEERSVRPDHRMVAHTGFITTARLLVAPDDPSDRNGAPAAGP